MSKDDGKYKGNFEVPPKSKGGRRRQKPLPNYYPPSRTAA